MGGGGGGGGRNSSGGKSAGLVIKRLRIRIPAGAAGEVSSPEFTFCADSYSVSVFQPLCYRSATYKTQLILPKFAGYT